MHLKSADFPNKLAQLESGDSSKGDPSAIRRRLKLNKAPSPSRLFGALKDGKVAVQLTEKSVDLKLGEGAFASRWVQGPNTEVRRVRFRIWDRTVVSQLLQVQIELEKLLAALSVSDFIVPLISAPGSACGSGDLVISARQFETDLHTADIGGWSSVKEALCLLSCSSELGVACIALLSSNILNKVCGRCYFQTAGKAGRAKPGADRPADKLPVRLRQRAHRGAAPFLAHWPKRGPPPKRKDARWAAELSLARGGRTFG